MKDTKSKKINTNAGERRLKDAFMIVFHKDCVKSEEIINNLSVSQANSKEDSAGSCQCSTCPIKEDCRIRKITNTA